MISDLNKKLLTLRKLDQVGPAALRKITSAAGFDTETIPQLGMRHEKVAKAMKSPDALEKAVAAANKAIANLESLGATLVCELDPDYPPLLKGAPDRPFFLAYLGSLARSSKSIAVIGTRQPTGHGTVIAQRLTTYFAQKEWSIVSGLALGCDAIAHEAALDCGAHTVAVLAHGLHTIAPQANEKLAQRILAGGGALVTEFVFGEDPIPRNFAIRDRTQAGLARGVVMIQSDLVGGSLHASRAALVYGRFLAVPAVTDRDLALREPKTAANLVLTDGSEAQKVELLQCQSSDLARLIPIRSKADYETLELALTAEGGPRSSAESLVIPE